MYIEKIGRTVLWLGWYWWWISLFITQVITSNINTFLLVISWERNKFLCQYVYNNLSSLFSLTAY